jgi:hypothetical protein
MERSHPHPAAPAEPDMERVAAVAQAYGCELLE